MAGDSPPIHLTFLSRKSFEAIGKKIGMETKFSNYSIFHPVNENLYLHYFLTRFRQKPFSGFLDQNGNPTSQRQPLLKKCIRWLLVDFMPVRLLCNILYFNSKGGSFGIVFKKEAEQAHKTLRRIKHQISFYTLPISFPWQKNPQEKISKQHKSQKQHPCFNTHSQLQWKAHS